MPAAPPPNAAVSSATLAPRDPSPQAQLITLDVAHEEGNFKMEQNFKLTEPNEIRTAVMNRADVCRELYNAAEFHLFGAGSWDLRSAAERLRPP
jgi:hypothetical protein